MGAQWADQHNGTATSIEAAIRNRPNKVEQQRILLAAFANAQFGLTDEEAQTATGLSGDQERPRRTELKEAHFVRDTDTKRKTRSGRWATVWTITDAGVRAWDRQRKGQVA